MSRTPQAYPHPIRRPSQDTRHKTKSVSSSKSAHDKRGEKNENKTGLVGFKRSAIIVDIFNREYLLSRAKIAAGNSIRTTKNP